MSVYKFFSPSEISSLLNHEDGEDLNQNLSFTVCHFAFSVIWTRGTECNLNYLGGNLPPSTAWYPIITQPRNDDDGEISQSIGRISQDANLKLSLGIQAVDAIPALAIVVTNLTTNRVAKFPAGNQYKALARGEFWQTVIDFENLP